MKCSAEVEDVEDCSYLLEVTMAVNPKIIMMVAQAAKSHKVREVVLHVVFYSLGISICRALGKTLDELFWTEEETK